MKQRETELKFRLKELPGGLEKGNSIKQYYFDISSSDSRSSLSRYFQSDSLEWPHIKEARLRIINNIECYLTLKSGGTSSRDEYEVKISKRDAEGLLNTQKIFGMIEKERFRIPIEESDLILEIDIYAGKLKGLFIAEVEYDPTRYPIKEKVYSLVKSRLGDEIVDVTEDKRYKNRCLAAEINFPDAF